MNRRKLSSEEGQCVSFTLDKEHYRRIQIEPNITVCHLYPTLASWIGRNIPDDVNPRSHDDVVVKGAVPKAIEQTIREHSEDFYLANRGETILAKSISYDPEHQRVEIWLTDHKGDSASHGVADGGTTDAVIARVQKDVIGDKVDDFGDLKTDQIPYNLRTARVHLEVIVGLEDRNRIARLVQGRNTSRQVKSWTIADFQGKFDWIKDVLQKDGCPFKDKVGFEENAGKDVNILEILAIMTLFHPDYNEKGKAPTVAYSSKGRMDKNFTDPNRSKGYKLLEPVLLDILQLHDEIYTLFHEKYKEERPQGKLGRRGKAGNRIFDSKNHNLPLTGKQAKYVVPSGILYPLLSSFRALLRFPDEGEANGKTKWRIDPLEFFDINGAELIDELIEQLEALQNNPQTVGKSKMVYTALHNHARVLVTEMDAAEKM